MTSDTGDSLTAVVVRGKIYLVTKVVTSQKNQIKEIIRIMEFILIEDTNQDDFENNLNKFIKENSDIEIIDYKYSTCMVDLGKDVIGSDIHYSVLIRYCKK